jgi:hypothetical protein
MDLLQVALIGPKENHGIFREYQNSRRVGPAINAHIEALPLVRARRIQVGTPEIGVINALSGHPDWQSICSSSMSRYVN